MSTHSPTVALDMWSVRKASAASYTPTQTEHRVSNWLNAICHLAAITQIISCVFPSIVEEVCFPASSQVCATRAHVRDIALQSDLSRFRLVGWSTRGWNTNFQPTMSEGSASAKFPRAASIRREAQTSPLCMRGWHQRVLCNRSK